MANLLVTGGAGYVGSHALRALLRAGHRLAVADDLRTGRADLVGDVPLHRVDIADVPAVSEVLRKHGPFEGLLHFAASSLVAESIADPEKYRLNNVVGSERLLKAAREHGVRAVVFSSTAAVYGHPAVQPIPESAPVAPINPYGETKLAIERMLPEMGFDWFALRYFNASGADPAGGIGECHDPETHLIPVALEAVAGLRPRLSLFGTDYDTPDGTCIRDYVHVSDLAQAHVLAIEALLRGEAGGAFNLGTGRGRSNREVLDTVSRVTGREVPWVEAERRPGDPAVLVADPARFRERFDWVPRHSDLEEIVATAWAWLRSDRSIS